MRVISLRHILIGVAGALCVATGAYAQNTANVSANGSVTIFRPITLTKNSDLSFGTVVRPISGSGTVTISQTDGTRTNTGSLALLTTGPNAAASRATYTVNGEGGQGFSISVPATFDMTRSGGPSDIITVTVVPTATSGTLSSTLGNGGTASFGVGGTITVDSTTPSGAYSGTFTTTVTYN